MVRLSTEMARALESAEIEKHMSAAGMEPRNNNPEEFVEALTKAGWLAALCTEPGAATR